MGAVWLLTYKASQIVSLRSELTFTQKSVGSSVILHWSKCSGQTVLLHLIHVDPLWSWPFVDQRRHSVFYSGLYLHCLGISQHNFAVIFTVLEIFYLEIHRVVCTRRDIAGVLMTLTHNKKWLLHHFIAPAQQYCATSYVTYTKGSLIKPGKLISAIVKDQIAPNVNILAMVDALPHAVASVWPCSYRCRLVPNVNEV